MANLQTPAGEILIVGAGPAGLMAADVLSRAGMPVCVVDAMASSGRKFLLAGRGGLNLTHAEAQDTFLQRYRPAEPQLLQSVQEFGANEVRSFVHELGIDTFVGSSNRVFPRDMKAAPLLRAWLQRLRAQGVRFQMRTRWQGWDGEKVCFSGPDGQQQLAAKALLLALGGGSWARLGSDGAWLPLLAQQGVDVRALRPSNCGFETGWSEFFRQRFAGQPLLAVAINWQDGKGVAQRRRGQFVITETGVEGSLIYALSADLRQQIERSGEAVITLDLAPDWPQARLQEELCRPRGSRSWASHLQSRIGLKGVQAALLREVLPPDAFEQPQLVAQAIKALPLRLHATRPIDEAISTAGGVCWSALDENWMLRARAGVFCAGEMLDWEAPTGGYLLTACLATGRAAAEGMLRYLAVRG